VTRHGRVDGDIQRALRRAVRALFRNVLTGAPFSSARAALLPGDKFVLGSAISNISYQASQILGS
jgi:hypothetical protein